MKKQIICYRFLRYRGRPLFAKREISFEIKLTSRLILDELCFNWNKQKLEKMINESIDEGNRDKFLALSKLYKFHFRE